MLEFLTEPIQVNIWYILLSVSSAVLLIYTSLKNIRLTKENKEYFSNWKKVNERRKELQREIKDNEVLKKKVYKDLDDQIDNLKEELEKEQKAHKNTKQYKYRAERARKERDVLKKQNETLEKEKAELQEFMVFTNKWVSEAHSILKKDYKNSQVKCISFKKFIEKYLKEGHELFR